jgi:hypothetical protein
MTTPIYVPELNGSRIYKVGRVGYETGTQDDGGVYTGILRSEKISPQGEAGWCKFRRVILRIRHTSTFVCKVRVYVDGVQTTTYDQTDMLAGTTTLQEVTFTEAAPSSPPDEVILQVDLTAKGTYIEVELECASNNVAGTFLPESLEVHYVPVRRTRQGDATA